MSALVSGDGRFIQALFNRQRFTVCISPALVGEFAEVLQRPAMRKYFTASEAERALHRLIALSERLDKDPTVKAICRDPKDDYLLALAKTVKADHLITGDADLLVLRKHGKTNILKPAAFRKKFL